MSTVVWLLILRGCLFLSLNYSFSSKIKSDLSEKSFLNITFLFLWRVHWRVWVGIRDSDFKPLSFWLRYPSLTFRQPVKEHIFSLLRPAPPPLSEWTRVSGMVWMCRLEGLRVGECVSITDECVRGGFDLMSRVCNVIGNRYVSGDVLLFSLTS